MTFSSSEPFIRLEVFEGPVELLLYLVRRNELDVGDIPIDQLTGDYLQYVRQVSELNLEVAADFLVMAAVLVRLKVRRLVPVQAEEDTDTPTVTLEQILDDFRRYQHVAGVLSAKEAERRLMFPRPGEICPKAPAASEDLTILALALQRVLARFTPERRIMVEPQRIRIEDMFAALRRLLVQQRQTTFEEAVAGRTLTEVIVIFLALLELVRLGEVRVRQLDDSTIVLQATENLPPPDSA